MAKKDRHFRQSSSRLQSKRQISPSKSFHFNLIIIIAALAIVALFTLALQTKWSGELGALSGITGATIAADCAVFSDEASCASNACCGWNVDTCYLAVDGDVDGICDTDQDNCPLDFNPDQADSDADGIGDACDICYGASNADSDSDSYCDENDNCPTDSNPDQLDTDSDGVGDICDGCPVDSSKIDPGICGCYVPDDDSDSDGTPDCNDICPYDSENDVDGDNLCGNVDNCPSVWNDQTDSDADGIGDACDVCYGASNADSDGDGYCDENDNCPGTLNPDQTDADSDGIGDACDNCPNDINEDQTDLDGDGAGDVCDEDDDGDGYNDDGDNCPFDFNPDQTDSDSDSVGDACDICSGFDDNGADADSDGMPDACDSCPDDAENDADGDGICGNVDNCPIVWNQEQIDGDGDGIGDECDLCSGFDDNGSDADDDGIADACDNCINASNPSQEESDSFEWTECLGNSPEITNTGDDSNFQFALPFGFQYFGRDIISIDVDSNGEIELLESGESCYDCSDYGTHYDGQYYDSIFALDDDLEMNPGDIGGNAQYGLCNLGDKIIVQWRGSTYSDYDRNNYPIDFEVVIHQNGDVQWNFKTLNYSGYGYDLFSGLGVDGGDDIELSSAQNEAETSYYWTSGSAAINPRDGDGIGDACDNCPDVSNVNQSDADYDSVGDACDSAVNLPETGQTLCYNQDGELIDCASAQQDGELKAGVGWPSPRFIDNSDGTITDALTRLVWPKDANIMQNRDPIWDADNIAEDGKVSWQHALDYIVKLNDEEYLGYADWRLPNINELASFVNSNETNQSSWLAGQGFMNISPYAPYYYWSSTTSSRQKTRAWVVYMLSGNEGTNAKSFDRYVWPVRSQTDGVTALPKTGQANCYDSSGNGRSCAGTGEDGEILAGIDWPDSRFTTNTDTVIDELTGIEWVKDASTPAIYECTISGAQTWQQALDYIACLNSNNHLGYSDWRLPNRIELRSVTNYEQPRQHLWLIGQGFSNVQNGFYWASTSYAYSPSSAWNVEIGAAGHVDGNTKFTSYYVWPVRGGNEGGADADQDSIPDVGDNCPDSYNLNQSDSDSDSIGDACDVTEGTAPPGFVETTTPVENGTQVNLSGSGIVVLFVIPLGESADITNVGITAVEGLTVISNLTLPAGVTKSAQVIMPAGSSAVCVDDSEDAMLSASCADAGEVSVPCPGTAGGFDCAVINSTLFSVSGLSHSAIGSYTSAAAAAGGSGRKNEVVQFVNVSLPAALPAVEEKPAAPLPEIALPAELVAPVSEAPAQPAPANITNISAPPKAIIGKTMIIISLLTIVVVALIIIIFTARKRAPKLKFGEDIERIKRIENHEKRAAELEKSFNRGFAPDKQSR